MLFIVPLLFIPVSEGALVLINKSGKYKFFIGALAMSLLFYGPVINSARSLVLGEGRGDMLYEDNREAVSYYKDHYQEADLLFFNHSAQYPFFYYINHYSLQEKIAHALGRNNGFSGIRVGVFSDDIRQDKSDQLFMLLAFRYYLYDNNKFKGTMMRDKEHLGVYEMHRDTALDFIDQKRVWVFLSHLEKEEKEFILKIFQKNGKQLKEKRFSRVSLHLFELDPSQNKANF